MGQPFRLDKLLADGISIPTFARPDDRDWERAELRRWHTYLEEAFPNVHRRCELTVLSEYAVYFLLRAELPTTSKPVLFTAHFDVVPAQAPEWDEDPFVGSIHDGAVWGRGAIDDKHSLLAQLEALEQFISDGLTTNRDLYFAFGGDEEVGGRLGASQLAQHFHQRFITFAFVLDEGTLVADGVVPGVEGPVAVVGTGEKGHATIRVTVRAAGGHAAHPGSLSAADRLARAIAAVAKKRFPVRIVPAVRTFVRAMGRHSPGFRGTLLRAFPLSAPLVVPVFAKTPETDALLRDTRAVTMVTASDAPNTISGTASAIYNVRLLPGTAVHEAVNRIDRIVRRFGARAELTDRPDNFPAPPESPASGPGYDQIVRAIANVWGPIPILPYLFTMTTDSRHYVTVTDRIYRFLPIQATPADLQGIHGPDEHISIENLHRALAFYGHLIRQCSKDNL